MGLFENLILSWKLSFISVIESGKAVDVTSENAHFFDFWLSCLCTFNPLSLQLTWVTTLVATTRRYIDGIDSPENLSK